MRKVAIVAPLESHFDRMSSMFIMPRYGTIAIATALRNHGYEVKAFDEYVRCPIDWDFVRKADYVCFGVMSFSAFRAYALAVEVRKQAEAPIIFGGAHPTVLPEECLTYCDYVVRNEGEETLLELLHLLESGKDPSHIRGLSYRSASGKCVHNPDREFMSDIDVPQDVTLLEGYTALREFYTGRGRFPALHLQPIQTSRGCPFNCAFCVAPRELGTKYRTKSIHTVLFDIEHSLRHTGSNTFIFVDNEFTIQRDRAKALLEAIIACFGGHLNIILFARVSIAREPEILRLMHQAGVKQLFLGIESVTDETLREYNKKQTVAEIRECVRIIHDHGLLTLGAIILGAEHDRPDRIERSLEFVIENNFHHAQFYSLYDFPTKERILNIPQLFPDHRFLHRDWRFFNSAFVIHFPKHIRPSVLQRGIIHNYRHFYSIDRKTMDPFRGTAYGRTSFKLFMVNPNLKLMERYLPFLETWEEGFYDGQGNLLEDKLRAHRAVHEPVSWVPISLENLSPALANSVSAERASWEVQTDSLKKG